MPKIPSELVPLLQLALRKLPEKGERSGWGGALIKGALKVTPAGLLIFVSSIKIVY